jgi:hypothetical protein
MFGFPWRMVYLGDPLYRFDHGIRTNKSVPAEKVARLAPSAWLQIAPEYATWPVAEIASTRNLPDGPVEERVFHSDDDKLSWCVDMAIGELTGSRETPSVDGFVLTRSPPRRTDWRAVLTSVHRDRLARPSRLAFDELLIEALGAAGPSELLMKQLAQIPPSEAGFRVWQALENCAVQRLARLAAVRDKVQRFARALDLWEEVMRLTWPRNSHFPSQFTERVSALAWETSSRRRLWLDRLRRTGADMGDDPGRQSQAQVVAAEAKRVQATIGSLGSRR